MDAVILTIVGKFVVALVIVLFAGLAVYVGCKLAHVGLNPQVNAKNLRVEGWGIRLSAGQIGGGFALIFLSIPIFAIGWQTTPKLEYADNGQLKVLADHGPPPQGAPLVVDDISVKFALDAGQAKELVNKLLSGEQQQRLRNAFKSVGTGARVEVIAWHPGGGENAGEAAAVAQDVLKQLDALTATQKFWAQGEGFRVVPAKQAEGLIMKSGFPPGEDSKWGLAVVQKAGLPPPASGG